METRYSVIESAMKLWDRQNRATIQEWEETGDCSPILIEVSPTGACNHHCSWCAYAGVNSGPGRSRLEFDAFRGLCRDAKALSTRAMLFTGGGEPLLHPNICSFHDLAVDAGLNVSYLTNGILFSEGILKRIVADAEFVRISLDAATPEQYQLAHRGRQTDWERLWGNLRQLVQARRAAGRDRQNGKRPLVVGVSYIISQINNDLIAIDELVSKVREIGLDYIQFKPIYMESPGTGTTIKPPLHAVYHFGFEQINKIQLKYNESDRFRVFFTRMEYFDIRLRQFQHCFSHHFVASISSNGAVFLCCPLSFASDDFYFGNIHDQDFKSIWFGERRKSIIEKIESDSSFVRRCSACRYDYLNEVLNYVRESSLRLHANFI